MNQARRIMYFGVLMIVFVGLFVLLRHTIVHAFIDMDHAHTALMIRNTLLRIGAAIVTGLIAAYLLNLRNLRQWLTVIVTFNLVLIPLGIWGAFLRENGTHFHFEQRATGNPVFIFLFTYLLEVAQSAVVAVVGHQTLMKNRTKSLPK